MSAPHIAQNVYLEDTDNTASCIAHWDVWIFSVRKTQENVSTGVDTGTMSIARTARDALTIATDAWTMSIAVLVNLDSMVKTARAHAHPVAETKCVIRRVEYVPMGVLTVSSLKIHIVKLVLRDVALVNTVAIAQNVRLGIGDTSVSMTVQILV